MTRSENKEAKKAYKKLVMAANKFKAAIVEFGEAYDPSTVGLNEWTEHTDNVMGDIQADIDSNQGNEQYVR